MEKQQLLAEVRQMSQSGELSQAELLAAFGGSFVAPPTDAGPAGKSLSLSEIMYYIGGGIVFLGIAVLCYQNWDSFGSFLRVLVTLGSAIAAMIVAILLHRYENLRKLSQAFFLIAGMLAPLGVSVALKESGIDINSDGISVMIYAMLAAVFLLLYWRFKQTILLFFGIVFATGLFHFIVNLIVGSNLNGNDAIKVWEYRVLVIGLAYMYLGYYFSKTSHQALSGVMYGFGSLGFLGAALALGGWQPDQNAFWELIYPLLVFGIIFLSVYVKSKAFLTFGTLFLIGYVLKLTGEYFQSGLGWPFALVLCGLAIMAIGYFALRINKKYLTSLRVR